MAMGTATFVCRKPVLGEVKRARLDDRANSYPPKCSAMAMAIQKQARPRGLCIVKGKLLEVSLSWISPPPAAANARDVMTEQAALCRDGVLAVAIKAFVGSPVVPMRVPCIKVEANEGSEVSIQYIESLSGRVESRQATVIRSAMGEVR